MIPSLFYVPGLLILTHGGYRYVEWHELQKQAIDFIPVGDAKPLPRRIPDSIQAEIWTGVALLTIGAVATLCLNLQRR